MYRIVKGSRMYDKAVHKLGLLSKIFATKAKLKKPPEAVICLHQSRMFLVY